MIRKKRIWQHLLGFSAVAITIIVATALVVLNIKVGSAQQGPTLQITSPPDGTVVAPGDTVLVVVTPAPDTTFAQVIIIGQGPIGFSEVKTSPPFEFSLTIPVDIRLGTYRLTASGATGPGTGVESSPITLIVEKPDPVLQLRAEPPRIFFRFAGRQRRLRVIGTFSDGITDVTESSQTTYTSNDVNVATVSETGVVTAVGTVPPGATEITTEIIVSHADLLVAVPVIFRLRDNVTIDIKPGSFPNTINLGSTGNVPVAIFSTPAFDARTVDPLSITLDSAAVKLKGNGTAQASSEDVNGDGLLDLVVHVETEALELTETSERAILEGMTFDAFSIRGSDFVQIVP